VISFDRAVQAGGGNAGADDANAINALDAR